MQAGAPEGAVVIVDSTTRMPVGVYTAEDIEILGLDPGADGVVTSVEARDALNALVQERAAGAGAYGGVSDLAAYHQGFRMRKA